MTVTKLFLPNAEWCPVSYRAEAGLFEAKPLGWILHCQVGNGSLHDYFNRLKSPSRKFSTAWVGKDGKSEQYAELHNKSWAQASGNGIYWSFETEGLPNEPLTRAQIETLAIWHEFLGVSDSLANKPGEQGIGTHSMGSTDWGGHACPGTVRSAQRTEILRLHRPLTLPPVVIKVGNKAPTFPYAPQHYFGVINASTLCHSGTYSATDRKWVRNIQDKMVRRGWKGMSVDGVFGSETQSIITAFQKDKHLVPSGRVGTQTWRSIWESTVTR